MNYYLLFKSLHLISVISWMAGLLYLPRIFVYHSEKVNQKNVSETFKIMEKKLMNFIMMPAMILSWFFGTGLVLITGSSSFGTLWLTIKIILVLILTFYHLFLNYCVVQFSNNKNKYSSRFYRFINEIPTILLILVVFIVIYKPL